jgi:hypothetical protein
MASGDLTELRSETRLADCAVEVLLARRLTRSDDVVGNAVTTCQPGEASRLSPDPA